MILAIAVLVAAALAALTGLDFSSFADLFGISNKNLVDQPQPASESPTPGAPATVMDHQGSAEQDIITDVRDRLAELAGRWRDGQGLPDLVQAALEIEDSLREMEISQVLDIVNEVLDSKDPADPRRSWLIVAVTIRAEPEIRVGLLDRMDALPQLEELLAFGVVLGPGRSKSDPSDRGSFWLAVFAHPYMGAPFANWPQDADGNPTFLDYISKAYPQADDRLVESTQRAEALMSTWLHEDHNPELRHHIMAYLVNGQSQTGRGLLFFLASSVPDRAVHEAALDVLTADRDDAFVRLEACKAAGALSPEDRWWQYAGVALMTDPDARIRGSLALHVAHWSSVYEKNDFGLSLLKTAFDAEPDEGVRIQIISNINSFMGAGRGGLALINEIIMNPATPLSISTFSVMRLSQPAGAIDVAERMEIVARVMDEHPEPRVQSAALRSLRKLLSKSVDPRHVRPQTRNIVSRFLQRSASSEDRDVAIEILRTLN